MPKVVSLFSGAGGLDLGFARAGFELVLANDVYRPACETHSRNLGLPLVEDCGSWGGERALLCCDVARWASQAQDSAEEAPVDCHWNREGPTVIPPASNGSGEEARRSRTQSVRRAAALHDVRGLRHAGVGKGYLQSQDGGRR